jgi:hypothetical protein
VLEIDENGVSGTIWLRNHQIAWDAIREYRVRIVTGANTKPGSWSALKRTIALTSAAYRHEDAPLSVVFDDMQLTLRVTGDDVTLGGGGFGLDGLSQSNAVLPRLHRRLGAAAVAALEHEPIARFGSLAISERGISWADRPPVPREDVEGIELFTSSDVSLHVTRLNGTLPYCNARLDNVPNIGSVFEVARAFGYTVRGGALLEAIGLVELERSAPTMHVL